jgi:Predicted Zn-dependent hydrolases of the beta-lactamase fold
MENNKINTFYTTEGLVNVIHIGHGSVHLDWEGMHIYVDPYSPTGNYSKMKKADIILITHAHGDHYDCDAIMNIATPNTKFIVSKSINTCITQDLLQKRLDFDDNEYNVDSSTNLENMKKTVSCIKHCEIDVLQNGDKIRCRGIEIEAIPAYNINQKRSNGKPYHIKGEGNGYILSIGDFKIYFAGDTEFIPEMKIAKGADIAFLPKNLPYTLSDEDFIKAANFIKPKNLFPIHYFEIDGKKLRKNLDTGICLYVNGEQLL